MRTGGRCALGAVAAALLLLTSGCFAFESHADTEAELLRKQVLTNFDSFHDEAMAMGSVRGVDAATGRPLPPPAMTESKRKALEAQRSREFNRDDIERFKKEGYVGENNEGLLTFRGEAQDKLRKESPRTYELVRDVVAEENADRQELMARVVETVSTLQGEEGLKQVRTIIASQNRAHAKPGEWIQERDDKKNGQPGKWVQKSVASK